MYMVNTCICTSNCLTDQLQLQYSQITILFEEKTLSVIMGAAVYLIQHTCTCTCHSPTIHTYCNSSLLAEACAGTVKEETSAGISYPLFDIAAIHDLGRVNPVLKTGLVLQYSTCSDFLLVVLDHYKHFMRSTICIFMA